MDSVTQMLFGATVAQAGFRDRLGRKALVAGAVLGTVPDLDVVVGWVAGPFASWEHHRGLTHSLLFGALVGPAFGWACWRVAERRGRVADGPAAPDPTTLRSWIWLAILVLMTHPIIDLFTSYGTQLLWPLTTTRFAIDALPIIDPVYSLILLGAIIAGLLPHVRAGLANDIAGAALIVVACYTLGGWAINNHVERHAAATFPGASARIDAYPILFQPYYRRIVAVTGDAAHVGYYSVLNPRPIEWRSYPSVDDPAVAVVQATPQARVFDWFAMGHVLWQIQPDGTGGVTVEATDLRYGLPGDTDIGFWGIRAGVGRDNALAGEVEIFRLPRSATRDALRRFWSDVTGL